MHILSISHSLPLSLSLPPSTLKCGDLLMLKISFFLPPFNFYHYVHCSCETLKKFSTYMLHPARHFHRLYDTLFVYVFISVESERRTAEGDQGSRINREGVGIATNVGVLTRRSDNWQPINTQQEMAGSEWTTTPPILKVIHFVVPGVY